MEGGGHREQVACLLVVGTKVVQGSRRRLARRGDGVVGSRLGIATCSRVLWASATALGMVVGLRS